MQTYAAKLCELVIMIHNVSPALENLLVPIEKLEHLDRNPRRGDVEGIMASYETFGQVRPIVYQESGDGKWIVIAGNHQLQAARNLGWTHIAAVPFTGDDTDAVAFALVDNRLSERGSIDNDLLYEMVLEVGDLYEPVFEAIGWDEFERATMDMRLDTITDEVAPNATGGYTPPVLINESTPEPEPPSAPAPKQVVKESGEIELHAPASIDQTSAVVGGATSTGQAGAKTVQQYSLVFENAHQAQRWWAFVRWLRSDAGTDGDTITERLLNFLEDHADF